MAPALPTEHWLDRDIPLPDHPLNEDGIPQYLAEWGTSADGPDCDNCGYNPTVILIGQRVDRTWDVYVTFACYAGTDLTAGTYEQAHTAVEAWRHLAPTWIESTLNDMARARAETQDDAPVQHQ